MSKHALVFAGGAYSLSSLQHVDGVEHADVWCADGGVVHAMQSGLQPNFIVGDSDSASESALKSATDAGARLIGHPVRKNASDLELTLREIVDAQYEKVTLLGVSGGRTDHALFNWMLAMQQDWPFQFTLIDETIAAYLVHSNVAFSAALEAGATVSLVCRDSVSGVSTLGLEYELTDARLMGGSTLGLSNEVKRVSGMPVTDVEVSVKSGRLMVCVVHS